jgi:hypothetical protein
VADRALARLCQFISFPENKTAFRTLSRVNNKVIAALIHGLFYVHKMIMNIFFRNF